MSMSKPQIPGKAQGTNPVASSRPAKKARTLPAFPNDGETSLEEKSARAVTEQYLAHNPGLLGLILRRMDPSKRAQAVQSIPAKDVLRTTEPYGSTLLPNDTIAVLNFHDSAVDMDYALLKVKELPDCLVGVLSLWLTNWVHNHDTAEKRNGLVEHDGSPQLDTDEELDVLADFIETYVEDLRDSGEGGEDSGGDEDGDDEFDTEAKIESIRDEIFQWLASAEWVKHEPAETMNTYIKAPKLTIRYQGD